MKFYNDIILVDKVTGEEITINAAMIKKLENLINESEQDVPIKAYINNNGLTGLQMSYDEITKLKIDLEECNERILKK